MSHRALRVGEAIQQHIAVLLQREINDPRVGMVTIAAVDVSRDLAHAKVYYSVLDENKVKETEAGLKNASGFLRTLLAKRLNIRHVPCLHFVYDDTTLKANRICSLIDQVLHKQPTSV
jgi:ribosome-binding factor A